MRVLIVEDDPMIGRALVSGLAESGYAADWVRDGASAELALRQGSYDLALLDLGLPRKDGMEVLKTLRRTNVHVPVLVISARDSISDRRRHGGDLRVRLAQINQVFDAELIKIAEAINLGEDWRGPMRVRIPRPGFNLSVRAYSERGITYFETLEPSMPEDLPRLHELDFAVMDSRTGPWRVYTHVTPQGAIQVAQPDGTRLSCARALAAHGAARARSRSATPRALTRCRSTMFRRSCARSSSRSTPCLSASRNRSMRRTSCARPSRSAS